MKQKIHLMKGCCMEHNRNGGYNTKLQILIQPKKTDWIAMSAIRLWKS